jgi:hypothetical protein
MLPAMSGGDNPAWPADKIERWPIEKLVPAARNARTHSAAQIRQLAAAIRKFGWTIPVLIAEDGEIIAGHGRIMAAQRLGIAEVPVMIATGWSAEQKRAYAIADNKLALNAGWDEGLLKLELSELSGFGFDMGAIGFSADELGGLFGNAAAAAAGAGKAAAGSLAQKFGLPPFSVLNAREGWWQARKEAWLSLGIQSEQLWS